MENNNNSNQTITLNLNKSNTAVAIALIVISCIVGGYLITYTLAPSGYHEMYILDDQNQAVNYPQTLIINQNNTFTTPIVVTNYMKTLQDYQIQVKIVHHTINFPLNAPTYSTYEFTLNDKQSWDSKIPVTINEEGTYSVVFELYVKDNGNYNFTDNYCTLPLTVTTDKA